MEVGSRSFEPVRLGAINVETGDERFNQDHSHGTPAVAWWRVNLTALSQRHNLYFVGTRDRVQVYRPDFPYQALGNKPALTIVPQLSRPDAPGYINQSRPHDINHLIVGDLGHQEILLLSTDSGNVVAYNTSSINSAISHDARSFSTDANADFVGLRPFFSQWVSESAWGLAIHKEGRMIAVSANTPNYVDEDDLSSKITVFAFALTIVDQFTVSNYSETRADLDLEGKSSSDWTLWSTSAYKHVLNTPKRDCNYKIVLKGPSGHRNNVPCITFVNGTEDRSGSWLLSTDITGQMKMWQIWKGRCMKTWNFTNQTPTVWTASPESGWLVAALDIKSFRPVDDMDSFIGHHRARQYYGYQASGDSYDLTDVVQRYTPQNSTVHPSSYREFGRPSSDEDEAEERDEFNADMDDSEDETSDRTVQSAASFSAEAEVDQSLTIPSHNIPYDEDMILVDSDDDDNDDDDAAVEEFDYEQFIEEGMDFDDDVDEISDEADGEELSSVENDNYQSNASSASPMSSLSDNQRNSDESEVLQDDDDYIHSEFLSPPLPSLRRATAKQSLAAQTHNIQSNDRAQIPLIPILHCSTSHVRLLSGPVANCPHIFCARMLRQTLPPELDHRHVYHLDRINMLHQIPELGIVLIATQIGRCAVCSLTRRKQDGLLGFRVDWILPTKRQERSGERPSTVPLLGIAASPIQGHEPSEPSPTHDKDLFNEWSNDRVIDGVLTTFDSEVVVLQSNLDSQKLDEGISKTESVPPANHTETRKWNVPAPTEQWKAHESSRRYRVMLTYLDMTVLTYELSRSVERSDILIL